MTIDASLRVSSAEELAELTRLASEEGLARALRAVLDPTRPVPATERGYTVLPKGYPADGIVLPHPPAVAEGLVLMRLAGPAGPDAEYGLPLAAVRLGLLRRMLDAAVAHLAGRRSDGMPLTSRQLVQAAVADAATTVAVVEPALRAEPVAPQWLHARLDEADRTVTDLFGAAGYLREHPVRCLYVAALVTSAWTGLSTVDGEG